MARLAAVEPNARFCSQLQAAFSDLTVVEGTIADVQGQPSWHAILSVNVLEHIREDESELAAYHRMLCPERGILCLFVPARPEIYAPLDQDFGHFRRYTKRELRGKLRSAGFSVLQCRYFNLAGYFAWWLNFCLLRKRSFDTKAVRWFDRFVFPLVYFVESKLLQPPVGQSLAAVACAATGCSTLRS